MMGGFTMPWTKTLVDSIKIPKKAWAITKQYKNQPVKHDFVFPELKVLNELGAFEVQRKISFAGKPWQAANVYQFLHLPTVA